MARKTVYVDDFDGSDIADGEGGPVRFSLNDDYYEMDLNAKNLAKLEKALQPFMDKAVVADAPRVVEAPARRGRRATPGAPTKTDPAQLAAMREWLRANGHTVGDKGRIAAHLQELYHAANK